MEILIKDIINNGRIMLEEASVVEASIDSWILAEFVFKIKKTDIYIRPDTITTVEDSEKYLELIKKRAQGIPVQHITGEQEFMGLSFKVDENVLIPRQDTELLVEKAIEYINSCKGKIKVLDMCTGSGCIAISIARYCPRAEIVAVDISKKALKIAKENVIINNVDIKLIESDLFDEVDGTFDLIVSNPPYIESSVVSTLMPEVREHEPILALDGDEDGLRFYRIISEKACECLNYGGRIMYEIGYNQGYTVPDILQKNGFKSIEVYKDLSGNDRVVIAGKE